MSEIPAGATPLGPGFYAHGDALHVDLDELIKAAGGDPENEGDRILAMAKMQQIAGSQGMGVEYRVREDAQPPAQPIGGLLQSFEFATAQAAKLAWEKLAKRVRHISYYRWAMDPNDPRSGRAVTVLCEEPQRALFEKACTILARSGGKRISTPELARMALVNRRAEAFAHDRTRRMMRTPQGNAIDIFGRDHGPLRRPQG